MLIVIRFFSTTKCLSKKFSVAELIPYWPAPAPRPPIRIGLCQRLNLCRTAGIHCTVYSFDLFVFLCSSLQGDRNFQTPSIIDDPPPHSLDPYSYRDSHTLEYERAIANNGCTACIEYEEVVVGKQFIGSLKILAQCNCGFIKFNS